MVRKIYWAMAALLCVCVAASAQTSFERAAEAYNAQRYADAVALYDSVEVNEGVSAPLYYNRGNAYYKMGLYAAAILNYERALLLNPGDGDTRANLKLANSKITDQIEPAGKFFLTVWAQGLRDCCSGNTWAVIGIGSFLLFLLGLYFYIFVRNIKVKKAGFFVALPMFLISVVANACAIDQNKHRSAHDEAIVFSPVVTVKSTPAESGTDLFILHEGTKVTLMEKVGEWMEVRIADGNRGWLPVSAIEII